MTTTIFSETIPGRTTTKAGTDYVHTITVTRHHGPYQSKPNWTAEIICDRVALSCAKFKTRREALAYADAHMVPATMRGDCDNNPGDIMETTLTIATLGEFSLVSRQVRICFVNRARGTRTQLSVLRDGQHVLDVEGGFLDFAAVVSYLHRQEVDCERRVEWLRAEG